MKTALIIVATVAIGVCSGSAETIHVPDEQPTIQAGIIAASYSDTVMVADGNYSGQGNFNLDFMGREIVLTSENGPDNCIINCQSEGQGLYFHSNETGEPLQVLRRSIDG